MYFVLLPVIIVYMKMMKKRLIKKRKIELVNQFLEALECICSHLKAGNSIEIAFTKVVEEIEHLQGRDSYMLKEIMYINNCIKLNVSTENAIKDFAIRADIDVITNFAAIFSISKRSDGNIVKVIQTVCNTIRSNIYLDRQIRISLSGVIQEINIMKIMPIGILIYLKIFSDGYFDCVYESVAGQSIMVTILIVYIVACTVIDYMQRKVLG